MDVYYKLSRCYVWKKRLSFENIDYEYRVYLLLYLIKY